MEGLKHLVWMCTRAHQGKYAYSLGDIYFLQLKFNDALASYLEAEQLDPGNAEYKNSIGLCYLKLGNYQKMRLKEELKKLLN